MRITPEAADGQFVIPVIDPQKYSQYREIMRALDERELCAVLAGGEKSPAYAQRPENLADMFPNDDCTPIYGSWMLPAGDCTPEDAVEAVMRELRSVHGFKVTRAGTSGGHPETCEFVSVKSRNVRRSIIFLSFLGVRFDWDTVKYGDNGVRSIDMDRGPGEVAVQLTLDRGVTGE